MYKMTANNTSRVYPETATSQSVNQLAKRRFGETIEYNNDEGTAFVLDADGRTLAQYDYQERFFSTEAYLNN
jgi:hypothetical protein